MSALRASLVLVVASLCACGGPQLVWYGHTPDRNERLEVRQEHGVQWIAAGDRTSRSYRYVAASDVAFAADGRRFAFAAEISEHPERWTVVTDFVQGPTWGAIGGLRFSPDGRVAYAALDRGLWRVVVDGVAGPPFEAVDVDSIAFSPDGRRVGYAAQQGGCAHAVVDGGVGPCVGRVAGLAVGDAARDDVVVVADASDGRDAHVIVGGTRVLDVSRAQSLAVDPAVHHWAVVGRFDDEWRVVADGAVGERFDVVEHVVWAPDGHTVAYVGRRDGAAYMVADGRRSGAHVEVEEPVFAAGTSRLGYVARDADGSSVVVGDRIVWRGAAAASALALSDDGLHAGWFFRDDGGPGIAVDAKRWRFDVVVDRTLRFSKGGRHWAALAGSLAQRRLFVVIDGRTHVPFDADELFGSPAGEPASRLAAWVSAELDRRVGEGS